MVTHCHLRTYKEEIEKVIKELLKIGHIRSNSSPFASLVVLAKKKMTPRECARLQSFEQLDNKKEIPHSQD